MAASSADGAGRVGVVVGSWEERVGETVPESLPRANWDAPYEGDESDLDEACMSGAEIVFTLDDPAAGAATIVWEIEAYAYSSSDEAVEKLSFELGVEAL